MSDVEVKVVYPEMRTGVGSLPLLRSIGHGSLVVLGLHAACEIRLSQESIACQESQVRSREVSARKMSHVSRLAFKSCPA
jgi:hypothetical protein